MGNKTQQKHNKAKSKTRTILYAIMFELHKN